MQQREMKFEKDNYLTRCKIVLKKKSHNALVVFKQCISQKRYVYISVLNGEL